MKKVIHDDIYADFSCGFQEEVYDVRIRTVQFTLHHSNTLGLNLSIAYYSFNIFVNLIQIAFNSWKNNPIPLSIVTRLAIVLYLVFKALLTMDAVCFTYRVYENTALKI